MADEQNHRDESNRPARRDADFPSEYAPADDEISLYDLWDVLVRRRLVLFGIAGLVVLLGALYALTKPTAYEYRSGIDLPRVYHEEEGLQPVVSRQSVMASLQDALIPQQKDALFEEGEAPGVEVVERGGEHSLVLQSSGVPEKTEAFTRLHEGIIETLGENLEAGYQRRLEAAVRGPEQKATMLDEQLGVLRDELAGMGERMGQTDGINSLIIAQQLGDIRREMADLRSERVEARSLVETIRATSHGTEQTFLVSESEDPVGTSGSLILALSVVLGGMLGVFGAFFWEFVSNARRYRRSEATG